MILNTVKKSKRRYKEVKIILQNKTVRRNKKLQNKIFFPKIFTE